MAKISKKRGLGLEHAADKKIARDRKARAREQRQSERKAFWKEHKSEVGKGLNIAGILLLMMLLVLLIRKFTGSPAGTPTFTSLLEWFSGFSAPSIPFLSMSFDLGDWGMFNFIRDGLSWFVSIVDVLIFFVNGILSVIFYVTRFFRWLFLV